MRYRSLAVSLFLVVASTFFADAATAQTYGVKKVVEFEQLAGQAQWAGAALERLRGARWELGPNGQFAFTAPNTATGTLRGTYVLKGRKAEFRASGGYQIGSTGGAQSVVSGVIDFGQSPPVVTMVQETGSVTAANVNGTQFGSSKRSAYRSVATLEVRRR